MHPTLAALRDQLVQLKKKVEGTVPNDEPIGVAHGNWSFAPVSRAELAQQVQDVIDALDESGESNVAENEALLSDYATRRIPHLINHTVPQLWGNAAQAIPAFTITLDLLRKALTPVLTPDQHAQNAAATKRVTRQVRGLEAALKALEPKTKSLAAMVERIEAAEEAAEQLPTDLEALGEARQQIATLAKDASKDQAHITVLREKAEQIDKDLEKLRTEAKSVLANCESVYAAATSVGLAAAFDERSVKLNASIKYWIVGLAGALVIGGVVGSIHLQTLTDVLKTPNVSPWVIILNLLVSLLSVGAPVWFAWLATKQIGQRFRLAEDYAFKASVSRAYEGYRREASRIDADMEKSLLASALKRMDEQPLRLVEAHSHGSPLHEFVSSPVVKEAIRLAPDFLGKITGLAREIVAKPKAEPITVTSSLTEGERPAR